MGKKRNKVEIFKLEDRVLFEAGAVVQAAEAAAADQANNDAAGDGSAAAEMQSDNNQTASDELTPDNLAEMPVPPEMSGSDNADDTADADAADTAAADPESDADADAIAFTDAPIAASETSERILVVLNSSVADADSIVNDLGDNVEVLRLTSGTDALDAINDYLDEHADTKYSAIHLVSHGSEGYITLNGEKIDSTTINPADWKAIGEHLTDDADILVYGCDTAKSEEGKALVQTIANLTGADVAASIDSTGANGDWDLEYRSGLIEAATIAPQYSGRLASEITVTIDGVNDFTELQTAIADVEDGGTIKFAVDTANFAKNADTDGDGTADSYGIDFTTTLIPTKNITIDGWIDLNADDKFDEGERVVFDGGSKNIRFFYPQAAGVKLTINDAVLQHIKLTANSGAAIAVTNGASLYVSNSIFRDNVATKGSGGAIYISGSGELVIRDSIFSGNKASASTGGAINIASGNVTIENTTFSGNSAQKTGGAIHAVGGDLTIVNSIFSANTSSSNGGALYTDAEFDLVIRGSVFNGNTATYGGALTLDNIKTALIDDSDFVGNKATYGGAVYTHTNNRVLTFTDSLFDANIATYGGAIVLQSAWNSGLNYVDMVGLTVINNEATVAGGGILVTVQNQTTIANSTIAGNIIRTDKAQGAYEGVTKSYGGAGIFVGAVPFSVTNGQRASFYLIRNIMVDNYMVTTGEDGVTTAGTKTASDFFSGQNKGNQSGTNYLFGNIAGAIGIATSIHADAKAARPVTQLTINDISNVSGVTGADLFDSSAWNSDGKFVVDSNGLIQVKDLSANAELYAAVNLAGFRLGSVASGTHQNYWFSIDNGATWYASSGSAATNTPSTLYFHDQTGGMRIPYSTAGAAQYKPAIMWTKADDGAINDCFFSVEEAVAQLENGSGEYYFSPNVQLFGDVTVNGTLILHGHDPNSELTANFILADSTDSVTVKGMKFTGGATISAGSMMIANALLSGEGDFAVTGGVLTILNSTLNNFGGTITIDAANGIGQIVNSTLYGNSGAITGNDKLNILNSLVFGTEKLSGYTAKYSVFDGTGTAATNTYSAKAADVFGTELVWDGLILTALQATPTSTAPHVNGAYAAMNGTNLYYSTDKINWNNFSDDSAATVDAAYIIKTDGLGNTRVIMSGKAVAGAYSALKEAAGLVVTIATDVVDEYDGYISLREAVLYAQNGETELNYDSNGDGTADTYRITFDAAAIAGNTEKGYTMRANEDGNILIDLIYNTDGFSSALVFNTTDKFVIDGENQNIVLDISQGTAARNIQYNDGSLTVKNLALYGTGAADKQSTVTGGGLVYISGGVTFTADNVEFAYSKIAGDSGDNGGALFASGATFVINNSTFHHNYAAKGAAVFASPSGASYRITGGRIYDNTAAQHLIVGWNGSTNYLTNVEIDHNKTGKDSHIIYFQRSADFYLDQLDVHDNTGGSAESKFLSVSTGQSNVIVNISNSEFYNNTFGQLIWFGSGGSSGNSFMLANSTIYNNTFNNTTDKYIVAIAGNADNAHAVNVYNNTIAGNTSTQDVLYALQFSTNNNVALLNNIILDNHGTADTGSLSVRVIGTGTKVNAYGNIYETASLASTAVLNGKTMTAASTDLGEYNTLSTAAGVFGTEDLSTVWDGKTLAISADGAAADSGVLVGKIGSTFYVMQDGKWYAAATQTYYTDFTPNAATGYGLGGTATVYTTAQNTVADGENQVPADRLYSLNNSGSEMIQVGAHALQVVSTEETLPVIVVPGLTLSSTYGEAVANLALSETQKEVTVKIGDEIVTLYLDITWSVADGIALDGTQNAGTYNNVFSIDTITVYDALGTDVTAQYKISPFVTSSFEVAKKAITVSANRAAKNYGVADDPALNYRVYGLVGSDTLSGELARVAGEEVGTYEIQIGTLGADNTNYEITFNSANFTIRPEGTVAPVITLDSSYTYKGNNVYGQAIDLVDDKIAHTIQVDGADVTLYLDVEWKAADGIATDGTQNAGTVENGLSVVYVTAYADDGNGGYTDVSDQYDFSYDAIYSALTVEKATITVTADDQVKAIDGTEPELTYTVDGLKNGDTISVNLERAEGEDAGTYEISLKDYTIDDGNGGNNYYPVNYESAYLTIKDTQEVTLEWTVGEYTYNGADQFVSVRLVKRNGDAVDGIEVTLKYNDADAMHNAGEYTITVDMDALNTALGDKYTLASNAETSRDVTVRQKAITVIADDKTMYEGRTEPALTYTVTGLIGDDVLSGALVREAGKTVGSYKIQRGTLDDASGNYLISFTEGTFTIVELLPETPSLTVTTTADVKDQYDQVTTLREAVEYALSGNATMNWDSNNDSVMDGYKITFSSDILTDGKATITLKDFSSANDGYLFIKATGDIKLMIDGGDANSDGAGDITITGPGAAGHELFHLSGEGLDLTLRNMTMTNGNNWYGGAIYTRSAIDSLTLENMVLTGNTASGKTNFGDGGGALNFQGNSLTIRDTVFGNNTANFDGGAVMIRNTASVVMDNVTFTGNKATGSTIAHSDSGRGGGAIYMKGGSLTITDSLFNGNTTSACGTIYMRGGELTLTDTDFTSNTAAHGAAVSNYDAVVSTITISGGTFKSNTATGNSGVIHFNSVGASELNITNAVFEQNKTKGHSGAIGIYNGTATLEKVTFTENSSPDTSNGGGAIYVGANATAVITESTFTGNKSDGFGGAIYQTGASNVTITGSTFTNNSTTTSLNKANTLVGGGAIYVNGGTFNLSGSTFTGNHADGANTNSGHLGGGGAIGIQTGTMNITGTNTFSENYTLLGHGGAIYNYAGTLKIDGAAKFINNEAGRNSTNYVGHGGALYVFVQDAANLTVTGDVLFQGNTAHSWGGAVSVANSSEVLIVGATFKDNSAGSNGAAVYNGANLTIINSTFTGNYIAAADFATAAVITNQDSNGKVYVINSTFYDNKSNDSSITSSPAVYDVYAENGVANAAYVINSIYDSSFDANVVGYGNVKAVAGTNIDATATTNGNQTYFLPTADETVIGGKPVTVSGKTLTYDGTDIAISNLTADQQTLLAGVIGKDQLGADRNLGSAYSVGAVNGALPETPSLVVTTNQDVVDAYDNLTSLREAIAYANKTEGAQTITFDSTVFTDTTTEYVIDLATTLLVTDAVTISNTTGAKIVLNGGNTVTVDPTTKKATFGEDGIRIMEIAADAATTIDGLIFRNGYEYGDLRTFSGSTQKYGGGGAIYTDSALTVRNSSFEYNNYKSDQDTALAITLGGGAIFAYNTELTIEDSSFVGNAMNIQSAWAYNGGSAICALSTDLTISGSSFLDHVSGAGKESGKFAVVYARNANGLAITDSTFSGNAMPGVSISGGSGTMTVSGSTFDSNTYGSGGCAIQAGASLTIDDCTFSNNVSDNVWGAVLKLGAGSYTVRNCTFTDNINSGASTNVGGGAIYLSTNQQGALTVEDCEFTGNQVTKAAPIGGGAIYVNYSGIDKVGTVNITGSTFANNSSGSQGGAIYASVATGTVTISGNTFTENTATGNGGAIYLSNTSGTNVLANNTFTDNSAVAGGAVYVVSGETSITGSTFKGNSAVGDGGALHTAADTTISNSIFGSTTEGEGNSGAHGMTIYQAGGAMVITNSSIVGSTSTTQWADIGAIYANGTSLALYGVQITDNKANGSFSNNNGGGVVVKSGTLTVDSYIDPTTSAETKTTIARNLAGTNGGGIYFAANTSGTIKNAVFDSNTGAIGGGGAIYGAAGTTISIENTHFNNNSASGWGSANGGAVNFAGTSLIIKNSLFSGNGATNGWNDGQAPDSGGGAIYVSAGTVDVINSTFYNNLGRVGNGFQVTGGTVNLVNSTMYSTGTTSSVEITGGTFNAINSIVCGTVNGTMNNFRSMVGADAADIFTSTTLTADNTLEIKADSAAAYAGALVGRKDGTFYYLDVVNSTWKKLGGTDADNVAFNAVDTTAYGLTGGEVYTTALNDVSRVFTLLQFNAGSHALPAETPSLTVNTDQDILNPFDGQISLREALQYAANDAAAVKGGAASVFTSGFDATAKTYTINFADTVTKITVGSTLNVATDAFKTYSLIINGAIASGKVILDGGNTVTFNADGPYASHSGTGVQIMNLHGGNKVTLNDLILQNGLAGSFAGGVHADSGTLNVNNSIFRYNVSNGSYNGGAALVNGSGTTNITGSLFEQNVGTGVYTQGGAFYTRGTAYISDSTFVRNWNNGLGGAIFSNGGYVNLLNSTIADNRANSGGAILLRTSSAYLINSTITGNTTVSTNNGAIGYSDGSVSDTIIVLNTIVAGNSSNDIANGNANTKISLINSVYGSVQVPADFANLTVTGGKEYDSSTQTLSDIFETVADGKAVATVQTVNGVDHEVFALSRDGVAAQSGTLTARTTTNSGMHGTRTQYYYLDMANDNWICVSDPTVVVPFVLANTDGSYGLQTGVQEHITKFDTSVYAAFKTYHVFEDAQNVDENGDRVDRLYALKLQEKPQEIFQVGAYAFNFLPKQPIALTVDGYTVTNTYGDALVLTETKKEITVTVDGVEKTYYLDLVWKTNGTVAEDGTQVVGTYEDVISIDSVAVFEKDGENYVDVTDDFELTLPADSDLVIGKATLTVTADAKSITVGGAEPELTYTVDGLKNGDVFTGTLVRAEGTAAGVYAITLADGYTITNGADDKSANYDFTFVGADLSIKEAASLTVTTLDDVVNDTDGVISFREAFAAANNKTASLAVNGVYTITFSQSLAANYDSDGDTVMDSYRVALSDVYGTTLSSASITLVIDGSIGTDRVTIAGPETYQLMNFTYGTITLQDMIITGGNDISTSGGAVKANSNGGVTIRNVLFTGNKAGNGGAAIYVGQGTLNIYDSEFTGNTANNGGVFYQGGKGTLNVYNSVFTGNTGSAASVYRSHDNGTATFVNSVFYGNNSGPAFELAGANNTVTLIDCIVADNGDAADSQIKVAKDSAVMNLINTVVLKGTDNTGAAIQITAGKANLYYSVTDADYSATANFSVTGGINNATFADTLEVVDGLPRVIATSAAGKNGVLVGKDSTGAFYVFGKNATGDAANWISLADSTVTAAFNVDAAGYGLGEGATVYMDNDMTAVMVETLKAKAELTFFAGTYRSPETITLVVNDATDTANTSLLTTTLREALAFCTTVGTKYNIVFANGVNNEVNLFENGDVTIYMSSGKGYSLSGQVNVTIDGSGDGKDTDADGTNNKVILDGRKNSTIATNATSNRYRIINAGNADLTLKNMTMQYGFVNGGKIGGGAVYTNGGSLTLNNMYFTGNQTKSAVWNFTPGGAIYGLNSTVLIVDSIFNANAATGDSGSGGGAIHHSGGTLTIQNSKFLNNTSIKTWGDGSAAIGGGAISMMNLSSFSISGSLFEGNTVAAAVGETGGGAIAVYGCATGTISDSVFTANKVNSGGGNNTGGGGAIHFNSSGTFTITGTTFENNESATVTDKEDKFRGGGAIAINKGSVVVEDSSFIGNKATNSGNLATAPAGGAITVSQSGSLSVTDTLFSENTTTASGGAIAARGSVTVRNSVFTDNAADLGGGGAIYFRTGDAVCSIYSSTFYGNSAVRGGAIEYSTIMWGGAKMNLHHVTLAANTATSRGGAIAFRSTANYTFNLNIYNSLILGNTSGAEDSKVCDDLSLPVTIGTLKGTIAESVIGTITGKPATFSVAASTTQIASGSTDYGLIFNGKASADYTVRFNKNYGNGVVELYLPARDILQIATTANPETDQLGNTRTPGENGKYLVGAMDKLFEVPSLVVNTTEDVVDEFDGLISLREAIAYQKADPTLGNTITFSDQIDWSTTDKTITLDAKDAEGNYLGQLSLTTAVTIDGSLMFGTVAQGIITIKVPVTYAESLADNTKTVSAFRVFNVSARATLRNMIVKGGLVQDGGGIYANAYLTLENMMVADSGANNRGGGICASAGLYAENVTVCNNIHTGKGYYPHGGGGMYLNGSSFLVNCTIFGNTSKNTYVGGSAFFAVGGITYLIGSTVTGNTDTDTTKGYAVATHNSGGVNMYILDSIVIGNNSAADIGTFKASSCAINIADSLYGSVAAASGAISNVLHVYRSTQIAAPDVKTVFGTTTELLTDENGIHYIKPIAGPAGFGGKGYEVLKIKAVNNISFTVVGYFNEDGYFCDFKGDRLVHAGYSATDSNYRRYFTTADGENFVLMKANEHTKIYDGINDAYLYYHYDASYALSAVPSRPGDLLYITRDGFEQVNPGEPIKFSGVADKMKGSADFNRAAYEALFDKMALVDRFGKDHENTLGAVRPDAEIASLVVNTEIDRICKYDGVISLREATGTYAADGDTVTFADALTEVTLDSGLTISKNLTFSDDNMRITGAALTIADAIGLTISTGSTFEITEGIVNNGTLANAGSLTLATLSGTGTLTNSGTLDVNGDFAGGTVNNTGTMILSGANNSVNAGSTLGNVTYDGADGQNVITADTYGNLVISTTGTATVAGDIKATSTTVNSGATLKTEGAFNGGTVNNAGNIDANSDFVVTSLVNTSGQVNLAGETITVTDLAASTLGNVTYDGATAQQVITGTYAALILSGAGTKTASGNITANSVKNESETKVTGDLAVSGAVESTKALTVGGAYSATTTTNSSALKVSGDFAGGAMDNTGSMTLSGATNTADAGSTLGNVTYNGAGDQAIIAGTYDDLVISSTGKATANGDLTAATTTNSTTLDVNGNFAGGTVNNTGTMSLAGATNSGTGTLGDVTYDGTANQQIIAAETYGDLIISTTGTATVDGNLKAETTTNSATLDVNGNFAGGAVNNSGSMTLAGASNSGTGTLGNVTYDGADQQVIAGTYGNLTINSTGKATATGNISAATVDNNANTEVTGNLTTTGDLESTAALKIGGSVDAANITTTGEMEVANNLTASGTVDSDTALTVGGNFSAVTTDNSSDLKVSGNYTADTTTTSGTLDVDGNFSGGDVTNTGSMSLAGASNTANAGSTLGDVTYNGTADQEVIAGTYEDLVISTTGKATANGDISAATVKSDAETAITGNLTATGNITSNGDMDVTGNLTTTGELTSTAALTVGGNASANNATLSGDTEVTGNLTATGDLASTAALTVGGDATANNATLSGETTITGNLTATGTVDSDAALTVGGNLTADTTDNSSDLKVTGNLTANTTNNSGTLDAAGDLNAGALTNSGSISVAGAFATTSTDLGAVEYDGTAAQNVVEGTYSELSLTGGDKSLAGAVTVTDSLTADANIDTAGQDLTISGDVAGSGTISTTTDSGTVTYDGADQNVLAGAYNNLALANGTKTLSSANTTTVNDTFTATGTTIQSDTADVLASLTVKDAGDDNTPSSAIAGTTFNGIALNNTGSADGYLYVNADTNNADDATTGVYLVGNVFVTANGIIYGDTLGEVCITVTNGNGDVISEGTADDLGWTWAVGNDAIENATTGTTYELVSKAGYKFRFHGDVNVVIGKRAITVKADDLAIDTGDDPVFTYTYVGELVGSDAFTGELASEGDGSQPGDFAITQGTLSLGDNYDLTFIGGTLTVEGGGQDAHQFPNYNNPGNFAGVYDAPVHSTIHSYDHHESVPTLEHQNDRSIGFLFSVSNKQLGDASGAFGDSAPQGSSVNIHAHTLSDLLKSYDKSEQIIASPANEIQDAQDDMKDLHDFSNNPFGILPDDEDLHTRAYDESIDFTVIGEDNLSTAKAEQFKDEFDAALEELLTLA